MDKFTKTTEIDISNMNLIEEEPPQKSKAGRIITIIISLLLSVTLWLYVTETDETKIDKEFNDIQVNIVNATEQFNITADNVSVVLTGTNSQLVDVEKNDIIVEIDAEKIEKSGDYTVMAHKVYVDDDISVEVKNPQLIKVNVHVKAAK
ncbi:MAG: hypothetical protein IJ039_00435 [Clostridia bacterium]|nr:hypothetical protein [Clostridia bacterium]